MIKDPYIGMPLTMGSMQVPCESCNNNRPPANRPGRPGESGSQNQEMGEGAARGCGPLGDSPELSWQGGSAGNRVCRDPRQTGRPR